MKSIFLALSLMLATFSFDAGAQSCDIQLEVLPDRFMYGTAEVVRSTKSPGKTRVEFNAEVMKVFTTVDGKNVEITVLNEDCKAYCKRSKRIRQLNMGDEKLVMNLIKSNKSKISEQLAKCELNKS